MFFCTLLNLIWVNSSTHFSINYSSCGRTSTWSLEALLYIPSIASESTGHETTAWTTHRATTLITNITTAVSGNYAIFKSRLTECSPFRMVCKGFACWRSVTAVEGSPAAMEEAVWIIRVPTNSKSLLDMWSPSMFEAEERVQLKKPELSIGLESRRSTGNVQQAKAGLEHRRSARFFLLLDERVQVKPFPVVRQGFWRKWGNRMTKFRESGNWWTLWFEKLQWKQSSRF